MAKFERFYDPEVLARIGRLELRARMVVEGIITGLHKSPYHGTAVEFADHRAYVAGDDPRHIDWKVYGRLGRFVIKKFEEETNLRAHIVLDCSESMRFGHDGRLSKYDYGGTLAASLAYLLNRQLDSVGLTLFDSKIQKQVPPSTGKNILSLIGEIMQSVEPAEKTGLDGVFSELAESLPRRGLVIVISDLFAPREEIASGLQAFSLRGHDVIVFHVLDETELTFPFEGNTLFKGLEEYPEINADPRQLQEAYVEVFEEYLQEIERIASTGGFDYQRSLTSDPLDAAVVSLIAARAKLRRLRR
ncbi:MAG: DUF58 domain-containing protein [Planctomycetota bacterium]|nr:DUF58 domain-containing protein [Planctomycetota bacterium]MEE3053424.1 DUF58 domain-containing protein [Planctomycetota bacterium]